MNADSSIPRLSIVIATWNAVGTLERCLRSIIGQSFRDWEILISDGASIDGTVNVIRQYEGDISWWRSEMDLGIYDAWNQALSHARGQYVAFLGADDIWHTGSTLEDAFAAIGSEQYDLVTASGVLTDRDGKKYYEFGEPWDFKKLMRRMTICHPGAFHRRKLFDRFGKFDVSYRISADYDFLLRLPQDTRTLHLPMIMTDVADAGLSRTSRWLMLRERYRAQAACPRIGGARATFNFVDKLWRIPIAKILGIPN